jgi:hypothetical protein
MDIVKWRWMRNGALIGLAICLSDLMEWRGQKFAAWNSAEGLAGNLGYLGGGALLAGLIGLCIGSIKDARARRITKI